MSLMTIDRATLSDTLAKVKDTKICVLGDFYLDRYSLGIMEVISREAPIPIIRLKSQDSTRYLPGAAGNVALNLADLGAQVCAGGHRGPRPQRPHPAWISCGSGALTPARAWWR